MWARGLKYLNRYLPHTSKPVIPAIEGIQYPNLFDIPRIHTIAGITDG